MIELITFLIIAISAVAAGVAIGVLLRRISKLKEEIRDLEETVEQEQHLIEQFRLKAKRLDIEKEELTRNIRTLQGRKIFSNVRKDPLTLTFPKNKLDKVLETMEREDLEIEAIANQDGPTLEEEAEENKEFMEQKIRGKL